MAQQNYSLLYSKNFLEFKAFFSNNLHCLNTTIKTINLCEIIDQNPNQVTQSFTQI
jgi:hypothetical protein